MMTRKRSWLALGALLTTLVVGAVWASEQQKKSEKVAAPACCAEGTSCCTDKCSTAEKTKGCCADGKCCGCCEKGQKATVLPIPVPAGSSIQVTIEPAEANRAEWAAPGPMIQAAQVPQPPQSVPVGMPQFPPQYLSQPCALPCVAPAYPAYQTQAAPVPTGAVSCPLAGQCVSTPRYVETATMERSLPPIPVAPPAYPGLQPWRVHTVTDKEHTCLEIQLSEPEQTRLCCESTVVKFGKESLKFTIVDKQVHVCGLFFNGTADSVVRNSDKGSLTFEGHADIKYVRQGQKAQISAEHVVVGITDGSLEVKPVKQVQDLTVWFGCFDFTH